MRPSLGCYPLFMSTCFGCCCGQIPLFGLWPELDEAEVAAAVRAAPLVVDHVCRVGETCEVVEGAEIDLVPIGWSPFTGAVTALVEVEATCRAAEEGTAAKLGPPFTCAGTIAAAYAATDDGYALQYVTEDLLAVDEPSGLTYEDWRAESSGGGGGWD